LKYVWVVSAALLIGLIYLYSSNQPLTIEAFEGDDLCGTLGQVSGNQGTSVALKSRPLPFSRTKKMLKGGDEVLICEEGSHWYGVILRVPGGSCLNHDVSRIPRHYAGRCTFGWLPSKFVDFTAG